MADEAFTAALDAAAQTATVTLCRGADGNTLTAEEVQAVGRKIGELGRHEKVKVVVIRAEGEAFCRGRRAPPASGGGPRSALDIRDGVTDRILSLYADVRATPVPVLAVVQGEARGFGCAFVGVCDLVVAADTARFSMPEMDHNLPPTLAISAVLGKLPLKRIGHLVYTRSEVTAAEALDLGLVTEVVPRAQLDAAAKATVARLADRHRSALCTIKEYMNLAPHLDAAAAARLGANMLSVVLSSPNRT